MVMNLGRRVSDVRRLLRTLPGNIQKIQEALGRIETRQIQNLLSPQIREAEFHVYSQWGVDGIIQHLLRYVPIEKKIFVEFGVENYTESNTRFLLVNDNWSGLIMDGSHDNIAYVKNDMAVYWAHNLKAECTFITTDNINDAISGSGLSGDIGLLSVDIDGNDYWVWEAIHCIDPRIVICEYNSIFGPEARVTIPYQPDFERRKAHYSNVYYGASLAAFEYLGRKKGYSLVGANSAGNNAFFVRNDLCSALQIVTAEEAYRKAQFRESMDIDGNLTFKDFDSLLEEIRDNEVIAVEDNKRIKIDELRPGNTNTIK
jgi:hypothetical protein